MRIFVLRKSVDGGGVLDPGCRNVLGMNSPGAAADAPALPIYCVQPAEGRRTYPSPFDAAWGAG